MTELVG